MCAEYSFEVENMAKSKMTANDEKRSGGAGRVIGHVFAVIGVTILAILIACAGALYVCLRGPSPTVKRLLTHSLHETSALYWIPGLYLSQEELDGYLASREITQDAVTNTELIHITAGTVSQGRAEDGDTAPESNEVAVPETNPDEDGDGGTYYVYCTSGIGFKNLTNLINNRYCIFLYLNLT